MGFVVVYLVVVAPSRRRQVVRRLTVAGDRWGARAILHCAGPRAGLYYGPAAVHLENSRRFIFVLCVTIFFSNASVSVHRPSKLAPDVVPVGEEPDGGAK